ncbi:MAG: FtsW/RodA/SpoVE family cell cycle protein, partial [Clostridia bacterium]|nr:FtsW/RodA/SpoVE family cell cycle protein [Clostridia bacterium]
FIIIGGMIKLIPLTGVTLPFISYGGTSLLISFFQIGVLSAIAQKSLQTKKEDAA